MQMINSDQRTRGLSVTYAWSGSVRSGGIQPRELFRSASRSAHRPMWCTTAIRELRPRGGTHAIVKEHRSIAIRDSAGLHRRLIIYGSM